MKDSELSLAVAKSMWTQYEWINGVTRAEAFDPECATIRKDFDYTTDSALGKMCVWLAKHYGKREMWMDVGVIGHWLEREENPHKALAEAIVATNET